MSASLGMPLDEWQEVVLEAAMGERTNGKWASKFVGLSAPRQNGKSQLIVARALAGILLFAEKLIIVSAHDTDTAREVWKRLIDVVEANPSLESRVTGRMNAINRESLTFGRGHDAQTIKLKARTKSGTRGFSSDCLLIDEGQHLSKSAWGSIVPTMSARTNETPGGPQLWLFGTPPTEDHDPFAFSRVRDSAIAGKARHCWLEWAATPEDDPDDEVTWWKANPAYGVRLTRAAVQDDRAAMDDQQFAMERLGMWESVENRGVIPIDAWLDRADERSQAVDSFALGVEVGRDLEYASVSLAGRRPDGDWHVELAEQRSGAAWTVAYVAEVLKLNPQIRAVVVDVAGPVKALLDDFAAAKVGLTQIKVSDLGAACARVMDGTVTGWLRHPGQHQLDAAVRAAGKRPLGDSGMWVFSRKNATSDITPIQSASLALWGAQNSGISTPDTRLKRRKVVVLE